MIWQKATTKSPAIDLLGFLLAFCWLLLSASG